MGNNHPNQSIIDTIYDSTNVGRNRLKDGLWFYLSCTGVGHVSLWTGSQKLGTFFIKKKELGDNSKP